MPRAGRLLGALVVLVVSTILVANHLDPFPGEVGLLEAVNALPRFIGAPLEVVMQLGTLGAALLVVGAVAGATAPRVAPAITVLAAAVLGHQIDDRLKDLVERPRPGRVLPDLVQRSPAEGFAFPSGHTTLAFALATTVAVLIPGRWRIVPFALATAVAVARMYVGVHWPTDLVGGAALGIAIGAAAWITTDVVSRRRPPKSV